MHRRLWTLVPRLMLIVGVLALGIFAFAPGAAFAGGSAATRAATTRPFTITSPIFSDGARLPTRTAFNRLGCPGKNVAPVLHWQGVPAGTESFAFALNDYDAPVAGGFHHWIVYNIPEHARTLTG